MKRVLGSLVIALTLLSCSSKDSVEKHALNNIKENIAYENMVYDTYESKYGYKTVYIQKEILKEKAANSELEISSIITKDGKVVKMNEILNDEMVKMYTEKIMSDMKLAKKGTYFDDAKVDLKDSVVILTEDKIIFIFPRYTLAPRSSGIPKFVYNYVK